MIIADTGFFLALANQADEYHEKAKVALETLEEPLITTWPVMAETSHLLLNRLGPQAQVAFLTSWRCGAFQVRDIHRESADHICQLVEKYQDLPMDLADASLVVLAEQLGDGRIFSTDRRDFNTYRWKNHRPFINLLIPNC